MMGLFTHGSAPLLIYELEMVTFVMQGHWLTEIISDHLSKQETKKKKNDLESEQWKNTVMQRKEEK